MSYKVTFTIYKKLPYSKGDKIETCTRIYPKYLCGLQLSSLHFIELVASEYSISIVQIQIKDIQVNE